MTPEQPNHTPEPKQAGFTVQRYADSRYWEVLDPAGELVCLTVYKRGANEVVRRLAG